MTKNCSVFSRDLASSLVVFLVAIPLCLGIAIASGVPASMGLVSGVVGGIVVGLLSGSPLQVSGPAAGLAVIVFGFVEEYGVATLAPVLIGAGTLQIAAGFLRIGSWFRAISPAVVHGMLAGIGILIILGQIHVLMDAKPAAGGVENAAAINESLGRLWGSGLTNEAAALQVGLISLLAMVCWEKCRPQSLNLVPGALIGVAAGTVLAAAFDLPIARVEVPASLLDGLSLPTMESFTQLAQPGIILATVMIAVIASAETLLSAAAVDRMHDGVRTKFNKELFAQGIGNGLCGLLGGLPITGVIVRSSANIQAGARTRASAILHGTWILGLVALAPSLLSSVPLTALAAVLLVTGWRLISLRHVRHLFEHHGLVPVGIWAVTVAMIVLEDLLVGVVLGLALSILEIVPYLRRKLAIRHSEVDQEIHLRLDGTVTCKDLPALLNTLEQLPEGRKVRIVGEDLHYMDHTSAETISDWLQREAKSGRAIEIHAPRAERHPRLKPLFQRFSAEVA
ncbi:SulP family inorganic anion transporter [Sinorhizobium meliloti]|uniref:SulP family inorganic anion transporter n=1 Tax=Rhizobium meliloti TaxID=382 RepID=UPI0012975D37|nr:SulP family inorganic anion transporter [Sinorhizobium meliloti]MDW9610842.1 SulP family inorganic anion transporter [Sinorhizobium meliloti]MDW9835966.1 SulP family inorganic anion transporter [Sinorhizobium meliloti]MDX0040345.1 SulP family inorganic anion transporter [Sinorhizobium meliloti]MDX0088867.1 SulP family inorganic anion transporter [Sinorhizobium meliloti]MQX63406.1 SulP family inorganic anion transporter [Sinorhizobium meliloti]